MLFATYELITFRSPNQYTISIDLLSIRISYLHDNQNQNKQGKQAKGLERDK